MKGALAGLSFHSFNSQSLLLLLITEGGIILAPGVSYPSHLAQILVLLASQTSISGPISVMTNDIYIGRQFHGWTKLCNSRARKLMISMHCVDIMYMCHLHAASVGSIQGNDNIWGEYTAFSLR